MEYSDSDNTIDAWYVDLPKPGCAPEYLRWNLGSEPDLTRLAIGVPVFGAGNGRPELYRIDPNRLPNRLSEPAVIYTGFEPRGFAISRKSVLRQTLKLNRGDKEQTESLRMEEVMEYSEAPLDPALFEVPPGFKKVRELYKHKDSH